MIRSLFTPSQGTKPHAHIRDHILVLTLPDAMAPVVWQMDLKSVELGGLECVPDGPLWLLRLRRGNGQTLEVARYDDRARAMAAFSIVHETLTRGPIRPGTLGSRRSQVIWATTSLVLFVILMSLLSRLVPPPAPQISQPSAMTGPGVPLSADDLFENRGGAP